jgi:hypothetical protein
MSTTRGILSLVWLVSTSSLKNGSIDTSIILMALSIDTRLVGSLGDSRNDQALTLMKLSVVKPATIRTVLTLVLSRS